MYNNKIKQFFANKNSLYFTGVFFFALIFFGLLGLAKSSEAASISVDVTQPSGSLKTFINFGQARKGNFDRFTSNEQSRLASVRTRLVRLDAMLHVVSTAEGIYNWTLLDGNIENVKATGAEPVVVLAFMPQWLADTTYGQNAWDSAYPYMLTPPQGLCEMAKVDKRHRHPSECRKRVRN